MEFKKLSPRAISPERASQEAAGFDLHAAYDQVVPAQGRAKIKTDLQICLPKGCYGRIAPRSGLALDHFIDIGAGVVDRDFRGNISIIIFNHGKQDFPVLAGDRVAQLILERICEDVELREMKNQELPKTKRGTQGFGSTGKAPRR